MAGSRKDLARRFYDEVVNGGNLDMVDELCSEDLIEHEALPGGATGREAVKEYFGMLREAFPDLQCRLDAVVEEGDTVVTRAVFSGTHRGNFMGIEPTRKRFEIDVIDWVRVGEDGRAVEHWGVTDVAGMMEQLGVGAARQPA